MTTLRPTGQGSGTAATGRPLLDRRPLRLAFLIPGGASLLLGLNAGLLLLGLPAPLSFERIAQLHAPLMVFGFVGTLVVLERAVAARRWWGFASPALLALGSLLLLSELPSAVGRAMLVAGMAFLLAIYRVVWLRQQAAATAIQILGAAAGLNAALLWLAGVEVAAIVPGMAVFLILTIAGERLELARISPIVDARAERLGFAASVALVVATALAPLWPDVGFPLLGAVLALLVVWLFRFDAATRLINAKGLPRYMAACLLTGYVWLLVAAGIWLVAGEVADGPGYDALVHSVFLGFVLSMIMAHAPVILPAVLRSPLPYRPFMYLPVLLLHASLVVRLLVGDARGLHTAVQWGGALNVAAVLLFAALAVASAIMGLVRAKAAQERAVPEHRPADESETP